MSVLVTGSAGSVGKALVKALRGGDQKVVEVDIAKRGTDILHFGRLEKDIKKANPKLIYHLAGAKHAPEGEVDPWETTMVNVEGTRNVLDLAPDDCRVIVASTCKACDPETVYGATKLIAERMALNEGHSVARFYNVREASGNVFETWGKLALGDPVPATPCERYFLTMREAVSLLLVIPALDPGRYTVNPGARRSMVREAQSFGSHKVVMIPPRRGDRLVEPRLSSSEELVSLGGPAGAVERIVNRHDL